MIRTLAWLVWGAFGWLTRRGVQAKRWVTSRAENLRGKLPARRKGDVPRRGRLSRLVNRSRKWSLKMEGARMRRFRRTLSESALLPEPDPSSVAAIFDQLSSNIITDKWEPKRLLLSVLHSLVAASVFLVSTYLSTYTLLFVPSADVPPLILIGSALTFGGGTVAFLTVYRQLEGLERLLIAWTGGMAFLTWTIQIAPMVDDGTIPLFAFFILAMSCAAGIAVVIVVAARSMGWRILRWISVIWRWLRYVGDAKFRLDTIEHASAWLLLMAPNGSGGFGWRFSKEIGFLADTASVERQGASWRALAISLVTFIGVTNVGRVLGGLYSPQHTLIWLSWANPAVFGIGLFGVLLAWAAVLEIWLAEFPNRIIGLACVQVRHYLDTNPDQPVHEYRNYRVVTVKHKRAAERRYQALGSPWILVGVQPTADNKWRCLIRRED